MIRVLHVLNSAIVGGAQAHLLSILKHSNKEKFFHGVALPFDGPLSDELKRFDFETYEVSMRKTLQLRTAFRIRRIIVEHKYDIVHTYTSRGGFLGRLGAILAGDVLIVHSILSASFHQYIPIHKRVINFLVECLLAQRTHKIVALSDNDISTFVKAGLAKRQKFFKLYSCEDLTEFYAIPAETTARIKRELNITAAAPVVGTVARFVLQKSPRYLLLCARLVLQQIPECIFVLVGDGPLMQDLKELARGLGIEQNVRFTGTRKDVPALMSSFDIFVLGSLWEGFPLVILEAMACKKPVIASAVNGIVEEVIDGVTGFLCRPGDYETMAQLVLDVLRADARGRAFGERGFRHLSMFSLDDEVARLESLYTNLSSPRAALEGANLV